MIGNQAFYPSKCNFQYEWNPEFVGRTATSYMTTYTT